MTQDERELDSLIEHLLARPEYAGHPLREALERLYIQNRDQLGRLERIAQISDGYQSMARDKAQSLSERYNKQLKQLEKVARISDRYQHMMRDLNLALKEASMRDALTGLANRRQLIERLKEETERASRHGGGYVLAMLDVDHFKQVNDDYGHDVGDLVLVELARAMEAQLRDYDLCGRWGGEEFLIVLPQATIDEARIVVERVRQAIRALPIATGGQQTLSITISIGLTDHRTGESFSTTVNRADAAMLEAKRAGRDRCQVA